MYQASSFALCNRDYRAPEELICAVCPFEPSSPLSPRSLRCGSPLGLRWVSEVDLAPRALARRARRSGRLVDDRNRSSAAPSPEAGPRGLRRPALAFVAVGLQAAPGLPGGHLVALRPWLVAGSGLLMA